MFYNYHNLVVYNYRISIGFDATIDELSNYSAVVA